MMIVATLVGIVITLMTPVTYGIMAWHDFNLIAIHYAENIAQRTSKTALANPELWYYTIPKSIDFHDQSKYHNSIKSIKSYDKNFNLKYEYPINEAINITYSFRTPVIYDTEIYGYIEIEQNIQPLITTIIALLFFFAFLGLNISIFLYQFPVDIIKIAEAEVKTHADQTKKQTEVEVARLDRLHLIGQMAAAIAHEIRNPLTTVKGYLQFFSRKPIFAPFQSEFDLMLDELGRSNHIITEFLSLSHEKAMNMEPYNLNQLIKTFQPLIESDALFHGISLQMDLGNIPDLFLDKKEIKQLILNLTRNGFEAMENGGCLSIKSSITSNYVVLTIIDQGTGITPELVAKLGTPFFTTKDTGTGLGLAVCYSIAHRHNAKIDFTTSKNGTTFSIYFPKIEQQGNTILSI